MTLYVPIQSYHLPNSLGIIGQFAATDGTVRSVTAADTAKILLSCQK
jgi:hypothetical protein